MDYDDIELLTPRRRRLLTWVAGVALLLAGAAIALHLLGRARLDELRGELRRHGPDEPTAFAPTVAAPSANAARTFLAVAADLETPADELPALSEARRNRPTSWSPETWSAVDRHLTLNAAVLARLHRAAQLLGGGLGLDYSRFNPTGIEPPWDLISAGRLLEMESHAALLEGDVEAAVAAVDTLGRLVALLHAEPDPTLQIIALDAGGAQLRVVRELVAAGAAGDLHPRLTHALAATADRGAVARAVRRQIAFFVGDDGGRLARSIGRQAGGVWWPASWLAGELLLAEGLAGRAALARVDQLAYPQLAAAVGAATSELPLGPFEGIHVELQAVALKAAAAAASRQLADLALALAVAGERDGSYPADLPDHPAATTPDPLTATLPRYQLTADGSARLSLDAAEAKAGSEGSLAALPFVWELPAPRPR
ncbi:MAG TPA: hypothetical protein VM617_03045 [Thermoanaerobaculia bacterium]|nr:hypothetical protein [Thermoanaerobaculia bacterium]